jgi:hypothetical protein
LKEELMSLADKLAATRAASATRIPPEKAAIMHRATEDLRRSGIMDRIIKVGSAAPAFALANHHGSRVVSAELLARGPLVVSFFRGSW